MSSESKDNLDPLFLVSRELDGDLTEAEARGLEAALAASPVMRAEAARMTAAHGLIDRWAQDIPRIDETALTQRVLAIVREDAADRQFADVDTVLRRWSRPVTFDDQAFSRQVVKKLRAEDSRRRWKLVYRTAAPLALAAGVAIAVTAVFWFSPVPVMEVAIGPMASIRHTPGTSDEATVSVIAFDRTTIEERIVLVDTPMISLGALGAEDVPGADDIPPL